MNTKISYMYRDGANYKIHCEQIVKGEISEEICEEILEEMDCKPFYPANIGFEAPTFVTLGYKKYSDDPNYHELCDLELTSDEPTASLSAKEFVKAFKSGRLSQATFNEKEWKD